MSISQRYKPSFLEASSSRASPAVSSHCRVHEMIGRGLCESVSFVVASCTARAEPFAGSGEPDQASLPPCDPHRHGLWRHR